MSKSIWSFIYATPLVLIGISWLRIYRRRDLDWHRISAWWGSIFTAASAMGGIWGLIIIDQLAKRNRFDYRYEGRCFELAFLGLLGTLIWLIRSRNLASTLTVAASLWITVIWIVDLETL